MRFYKLVCVCILNFIFKIYFSNNKYFNFLRQYAAAAAALSGGSSSTSPIGPGTGPAHPSLLLYPPPYPLALSWASSCLSSAAAASLGSSALERMTTKSSSIADLRLKARRHAEALGLLEKHN